MPVGPQRSSLFGPWWLGQETGHNAWRVPLRSGRTCLSSQRGLAVPVRPQRSSLFGPWWLGQETGHNARRVPLRSGRTCLSSQRGLAVPVGPQRSSLFPWWLGQETGHNAQRVPLRSGRTLAVPVGPQRSSLFAMVARSGDRPQRSVSPFWRDKQHRPQQKRDRPLLRQGLIDQHRPTPPAPVVVGVPGGARRRFEDDLHRLAAEAT